MGRLVARFPSSAALLEPATLLGRLAGVHMTGVDPPPGPDDVLSIAHAGRVLVLYHPLGGIEQQVRRYLETKGAKVYAEEMRLATISVFFRITADDPLLRGAMEDELRVVTSPRFTAPWSSREADEQPGAFFLGGLEGRCAFHVPIHLAEMNELYAWLDTKYGVRKEDALIRLCEDRDRDRLRAITTATCTACGGALDLIDANHHELEIASDDQLACGACGGMFELESILSLAT